LQAIKRILEVAKKYGIHTLDTAIGYGSSEEVLGQAGIREFKVTTKLPPIDVQSRELREYLQGQTVRSLERLNVNCLNNILFHEPRDLLKINSDKIFDAVVSLKNTGLVKKIGVSVYDPSTLLSIVQNFDIDVVQAPYSIVDRRFETSGLIDILHKKEIEFHARSIFLQGVLLQDVDRIPSKLLAIEPKLADWSKITDHHSISRVGICLGFVLNNPNVDFAVVGTDTDVQLRNIIDSLAEAHSANDFEWLETFNEDVIDPRLWGNY
jgi:hypothetical protein